MACENEVNCIERLDPERLYEILMDPMLPENDEKALKDIYAEINRTGGERAVTYAKKVYGTGRSKRPCGRFLPKGGRQMVCQMNRVISSRLLYDRCLDVDLVNAGPVICGRYLLQEQLMRPEDLRTLAVVCDEEGVKTFTESIGILKDYNEPSRTLEETIGSLEKIRKMTPEKLLRRMTQFFLNGMNENTMIQCLPHSSRELRDLYRECTEARRRIFLHNKQEILEMRGRKPTAKELADEKMEIPNTEFANFLFDQESQIVSSAIKTFKVMDIEIGGYSNDGFVVNTTDYELVQSIISKKLNEQKGTFRIMYKIKSFDKDIKFNGPLRENIVPPDPDNFYAGLYIDECTDAMVASKILTQMRSKIIYLGDSLYLNIDGKRWERHSDAKSGFNSLVSEVAAGGTRNFQVMDHVMVNGKPLTSAMIAGIGRVMRDMMSARQVKAAEFFRQIAEDTKDLLWFRDGVYNFRTREFLPQKKISKAPLIRLDYDFPRWENITEEHHWLWENTIRTIFKDCTSSDPIPISERVWLIANARAISGRGASDKATISGFSERNSGKSATVKLQEAAFGDYFGTFALPPYVEKPKSTDTGKDNSFLINSGLHYKRVVVHDEADPGVTYNGAILKALQGGTEIQSRGMYQNTDSYTCTALVFLYANKLSRIEPADAWQCVHQLRFTHIFSNKAPENLLPNESQANEELGSTECMRKLVPLFMLKLFDAWTDSMIGNTEECKLLRAYEVEEDQDTGGSSEEAQIFDITEFKRHIKIVEPFSEAQEEFWIPRAIVPLICGMKTVDRGSQCSTTTALTNAGAKGPLQRTMSSQKIRMMTDRCITFLHDHGQSECAKKVLNYSMARWPLSGDIRPWDRSGSMVPSEVRGVDPDTKGSRLGFFSNIKLVFRHSADEPSFHHETSDQTSQ